MPPAGRQAEQRRWSAEPRWAPPSVRLPDGGQGAAIGAAAGTGVGGAAAAGSSVKPAVIAAQTPQAFTLAVPLQVELTTNVAVR